MKYFEVTMYRNTSKFYQRFTDLNSASVVYEKLRRDGFSGLIRTGEIKS